MRSHRVSKEKLERYDKVVKTYENYLVRSEALKARLGIVMESVRDLSKYSAAEANFGGAEGFEGAAWLGSLVSRRYSIRWRYLF